VFSVTLVIKTDFFPKRITRLAPIIDTDYVPCELGTEYLNVILMDISLQNFKTLI
jgi:hypothetical protein